MNIPKVDIWNECYRARDKAQASDILGRLYKHGITDLMVRDFLRNASDRLSGDDLVRLWEVWNLGDLTKEHVSKWLRK